MSVFSGVGVALLTLRDSADEPDAAATAEHAAALAARGMRAVLACGTTGEAGRLSDDHRSEIISAVRAAVPAWPGRWVAPARSSESPTSRPSCAPPRLAARGKPSLSSPTCT